LALNEHWRFSRWSKRQCSLQPQYSAERDPMQSLPIGEQENVISLLFQTGYLTVKSVERALWGAEYRLGYPNRKVADAFPQHLLTDYLQTNSNQ